jgi:hypothetical protein
MPVMLACAIGILVPAASAHAQAALDQYIPSPKPSDSGENAGSPSGTQGQAPDLPGEDKKRGGTPDVQPAPAGDTGSDSGVDVPGTDFPLTPFAAAVGGALVLGLLGVLTYTVVRRRRTASPH